MERRAFIALLIGTIPSTAAGQQPRRIHRLAIATPSLAPADVSETGHPYFRQFFGELRRLGHIEGENLSIDRHSAENNFDRFSEIARTVVELRPDLIFANSGRLLTALKATGTTIPIVGISADPVANGLAESLARPGGNITGVTVDAGLDVWEKRIQLLREAAPKGKRLGFIAPRGTLERRNTRLIEEVARRLDLAFVVAAIGNRVDETELTDGFAMLVRANAPTGRSSPTTRSSSRFVASSLGSQRRRGFR